MAKTARGKEFWEPHVEGLRSSGKTSVAYATEHDLSVHALGWWRRKLNSSAPAGAVSIMTKSKASKFVALKLSAPMMTHPSGVMITIAGDVRVQMADLPPPAWLAEVSQAMRGTR